jgi:hypothetical protein
LEACGDERGQTEKQIVDCYLRQAIEEYKREGWDDNTVNCPMDRLCYRGDVKLIALIVRITQAQLILSLVGKA